MNTDVVIPEVGESISSGLLAVWLKKDEEYVSEGDELFELETDKTTLAVPATDSGILRIQTAEGEEVEVGQVVGLIDTSAEKPASEEPGQHEPAVSAESEQHESGSAGIEAAAARPAETASYDSPALPAAVTGLQFNIEELSPAVRRIVVENRLDPSSIKGTGKDGRITKEDAQKAAIFTKKPQQPPAGVTQPVMQQVQKRSERQSRVKMSRLRSRIAENLVYSKQNAAHLTTFNEIDMSEVIETRKTFREDFENKHGVRLGFMSFFIKACQKALEAYPEINAFIDGDEIVYNNFYDIAMALSSNRGLITPVVREVDRKGFAEIEGEILNFKKRAEEKKLMPDELTGATFTITNGGVFGSLLSTPIPNPPQTAILGMHAIQKRPVAVNDEIVIRPMMYAALTYDHRLIDGREAIGFLIHIKRLIEDPRRLLLGL